MKFVLAIAVLVFVGQAHGYSSGRHLSVDVNGEATKVCQDCLNFFKDIQQIVASGNTSAQLEQLIDQMICSQMGGLQDICHDLVHQYVPLALQYLAQMESPRQVCGLMGFCTQEVLRLITVSEPKKLIQGEECDLCKTTVNELKDIVRNPQYQTMIKNFIENNFCSVLGSLASECKQEVETYATMVFELLENELDPVAVCQTLGMCTQTKTISLTRIGLASSATKVKVIKPQKKVAASEQCVLCEFAIKELDQILGQNRTKAEIEAALDQLCDILPSTIKAECTQFVDQYGPEIIDLLLQELDPKQICTQIGLCTGAKKMTEPAPSCVLCEFAMNEIDKLLANNKSEANVEEALKKVCGLLPSTISAECKKFVDDYGPAIINLLVQELDPEEICKTLRLCNSTGYMHQIKAMKMSHPQMQKKLSASVQCVACEFVMKELDSLLSDNASRIEIKMALDKVCSILPSTVRNECTTFVNTYEQAVIELLVQELDPEEVCMTLGLCAPPSGRKDKPLKQKLRGEECELCVEVMNYVDELLKENFTTQDVEMVLEKVCNFLGGQLRSQCNQLVEQYAPLIVDLIASDLNPREICEALKLCNATQKAAELRDNKLYFKGELGTDKCTYGPSYWCNSKETAELCGAMEHCRKHVWN